VVSVTMHNKAVKHILQYEENNLWAVQFGLADVVAALFVLVV